MKKAYFVVLILLLLLLLLLLLFAAGCMENSDMIKREPMPSDISSQENSEGGFIHVNTETAIVDVINHPAFKGFGRFLFPTEHGLPDKEMRLNQIDSLLPYHNNINSDTTVYVLNYGHSDYTMDDPPTFVVVGERDGIANPSTLQRRINALKSAGINTEYHEYPNLGHGFGLGIGTSAEGWLNDAVQFWEKQMSD